MHNGASGAPPSEGWHVFRRGEAQPRVNVGFPPEFAQEPVVLTVPLHVPKFEWSCHLLHSASSRYAVVPVFSTRRSMHWWASAYAGAFDAAALIVSLRLGETDNPVTTKKLVATRRIFADAPASVTHVVALDAESEVTGDGLLASIMEWERRRTLALWRECPTRGGWRWLKDGDGCHGGWESGATLVSCASVGLPPLPGYAWFADAPVYSRADFGAFLERINWRACDPVPPPQPTPQAPPQKPIVSCVRRNVRVYDHLMYACYKKQIGNWSAAVVDFKPESYFGCDDPNVQTMWSRAVCARTSLRFHHDRKRRYGADGKPLRTTHNKHLETGHEPPPHGCPVAHNRSQAEWLKGMWAFVKPNLRYMQVDM
jgi:hypothetical protein